MAIFLNMCISFTEGMPDRGKSSKFSKLSLDQPVKGINPQLHIPQFTKHILSVGLQSTLASKTQRTRPEPSLDMGLCKILIGPERP